MGEMPSIGQHVQARSRNGCREALRAFERNEGVILRPDDQGWRANFGEHAFEGRVMHVRLEAHAHRHGAASFADSTKLLDWGVGVHALKLIWIVEATLDHLTPGHDEDVEQIGLFGTDAGWTDEHQMAEPAGVYNSHLSGDPATKPE